MLIGKDWKIETDPMNVILYRRTKKATGEMSDRWKIHGYFATVKNALHELANQEVRDVGLVDLRVLDAKIECLHQTIESLSGSLQQATGLSKPKKGIRVPVGGKEG